MSFQHIIVLELYLLTKFIAINKNFLLFLLKILFIIHMYHFNNSYYISNIIRVVKMVHMNNK